ncbi:nucleotide sugar dehydrogenase [Xylaria venustula]|nr:nucleotide sugar dehydrogenase [Xylaria venustula]
MSVTIPKIKNVCCVGAGYVGGPSSTILALKVPDIDVTVVDKSAPRVEAWNSDQLPFSEPGLLEAVQGARGGKSGLTSGNAQISERRPNLFFSTDVDETIRKADLIFVAVETPSGKRDGVGNGAAPNLTSFHAVLKHIAKTVEHDFILVNKSTVPCGSADAARNIIAPYLQPGIKFQVLSNPEFLAEGTAVSDLTHPDRIIIGCDESKEGFAAANALADLYARWVSPDKIVTLNSRASELSKLAANALLAQRISSINALSAICDKIGADITQVSSACGLDKRIGKHMLRSTLGFGGSCFEKDVLHLTNTAATLGLPDVASYLESIVGINTYQTDRFTQNIMSRVPSSPIGRRTVLGMLGFAFKPDTDDTRCSPAIPVIRDLVVAGYQIKIYDPLVEEEKIRQDLNASLPQGEHLIEAQVSVVKNVYEACDGANGIAILNSWKDLRYVPIRRDSGYSTPIPDLDIKKNDISMPTTIDRKQIDWQRIADRMHSPMYIFDGHNILDPRLTELGFCIDGVGRPVLLPGESSVSKTGEEPANGVLPAETEVTDTAVADISVGEMTTPITPLITV